MDKEAVNAPVAVIEGMQEDESEGSNGSGNYRVNNLIGMEFLSSNALLYVNSLSNFKGEGTTWRNLSHQNSCS